MSVSEINDTDGQDQIFAFVVRSKVDRVIATNILNSSI